MADPLAAGEHGAAVSLDDRADDRQANAGSPAGTRSGGVDAIEAFKDAVEVLESDAFAGVGDGDVDESIAGVRGDADAAACRGVAQRVGEQVGEDFGDPFAVDLDGGCLGLGLGGECDCLGLVGRGRGLDRVVDDRLQRDRVAVQLELVGFGE